MKWITTFLLILAGTMALADTPLRKLARADEARKWVAVGRVNIGHDGFCTGTLIESNIVLTAAHCFFDQRTGKRVADSSVRFVAGWSSGSADSIRGARRVVVDADYRYSTNPTNAQIANDIALIELDQPILNTVATPFSRSQQPRKGSSVGIVSYAQGRSEIPSIQDACTVLDRSRNVMVLSCNVTFGASGSPIFDMSGGVPRVVSVVSAKGFFAGRPAAFTMRIDEKVEVLLQKVTIGAAKRKSTGVATEGLNEQLGRNVRAIGGGLPQITGN